MWLLNAIRRFLTFLASMGLTVKDDRPRVIDMTGREWGESAAGLALSIREMRQDDPRQLPVLSVVLRNAGLDQALGKTRRKPESAWLVPA